MNDDSAAHHIRGAASGRRLLLTLLAFSAEHPERNVADLADEIGVPSSTMYRYLAVLRETGLVEPADRGRFRLTEAFIGLAAAAEAARTDLVKIAHPFVEQLRDDVDETVVLVRRSGDNAYCIDRAESHHAVRLQFALGQSMPLHSGSAARVLLAAMPHRERTRYITLHHDVLPVAQIDATSNEALDLVDTNGWTESFEEVDAGIWGCAAAIMHNGEVIASIGTAGPIFRLDENRRREIISQVRQAADAITHALR